MEVRKYEQTPTPLLDLSFLTKSYPSILIILSVIVESSLVSLRANRSMCLLDIDNRISSIFFGRLTMLRELERSEYCRKVKSSFLTFRAKALCFLSDEGPSLETLENYSLHFGSTLTFPVISLPFPHCLRSTIFILC